MQYRQLGKWGVKLSTIGLGSYLTIGHYVDDETSKACVKLAFDNGINWFDTANAYNRGGAETALGKLLRDYRRDSYVLATKVWGPMGEGVNDRGLSAKHIFEQCHASLKRLQTDYIDLYQCHRFDPETPVEESVRVMEDLARQGKILYWGTSEWTAAQLQEAVGVCRQLGCRPPVSNQPRYNLMWRHPEPDVYPTCLQLGIGNVIFSPLAHGVLSAKYEPGQPPPPGTRAAEEAQNAIMMNLYWGDEKLKKAKQVQEIAGEMGITAAQLAVAWCLRHEAVTSVIIGATRVEQMQETVAAGDIEVPDDVYERLNDMYALPELQAP